jgi:hypothetical protein
MPVSVSREVMPGIHFGADSESFGSVGPSVIVPSAYIAILSDEDIGRAARSMGRDAERAMALDFADYIRAQVEVLPRNFEFVKAVMQDKRRSLLDRFAMDSPLIASILVVVQRYEARLTSKEERDATLATESLSAAEVLRHDIRKNYDKLFVKIGRRDGFHCRRCHNTYNLEIDHSIAIANGGTNALPNLQLLCNACNGSKSDKE